ncbi:head GIN domain-containing protein [Geodermatophilus sp. URMC 64]
MRGAWVAAAVVLLTGCGLTSFTGDPGPARSEDRPVEAVSGVELATSGELVLTTGDTPSLRITAGENVLDQLTSEVRDGRLVLDAERSVGDLGDVRYELVMPAAATLEVSGSGTLRAEGLDVDELRVRLSGSGTVTLDGRAGRQVVEVDGSGQYDARQLDSKVADVTISGSGSADVEVSDFLVAVVTGSGTVTYGGGPEVERHVDGSGSVEER